MKDEYLMNHYNYSELAFLPSLYIKIFKHMKMLKKHAVHLN